MGYKLFEYDQKAYEAAVTMLAETGKAAVIHPAGIGKLSFGFKLCREHSDKTVCWLYTSKKIFEAQTECLKEASNAALPQNVKLFTYERLMEMSAEEMNTIDPDYIILDEFRFCCTEVWDTGVRKLLELFPKAPVLLLSATALCYSGRQCNSADKPAKCKNIFGQLDEIVISRDMHDYVFERNYHVAVEYYRQHGDLECPSGYISPDGIRLGAWIQYLRTQRKKNRKFLTDEQYQLLNAVGMRWDNKHDIQWNEAYSELCEYHSRHENINVPAAYKTDSQLLLGRWIRRQKEAYAKGRLRPDRIERLEKLGIVWEHVDPWEKNFRLAKEYSEAHNGVLNVPADYVVKGVRLYNWLREQRLIGEGRRKKQLTPEQRKKLESIGLVFGKICRN